TGVHGANRLASNSLLEAAAFGRRAGRAAAVEAAGSAALLKPTAGADLDEGALASLRAAMTAELGVIRDAAGLTRLLDLIARLERGTPSTPVLVAARLMAQGALDRRESRGGHYRSDFPETWAEARHTRFVLEPDASIAAA
ncbi:MAG: L-aspartate oxidase, partial [Brevundimonas sp.]